MYLSSQIQPVQCLQCSSVSCSDSPGIICRLAQINCSLNSFNTNNHSVFLVQVEVKSHEEMSCVMFDKMCSQRKNVKMLLETFGIGTDEKKIIKELIKGKEQVSGL